jgi:cysteinyl-tRNA synthetase
MSKSKGNIYRLYDLEKEGYDAMDLRYLYLQTHYRQEMNFTFGGLDAAKNALGRLRNIIVEWAEGEEGSSEYEKAFLEALQDDLNMPKALSIVWEMVRSDIPNEQKMRSLLKMDEVLGLGLREYVETTAKKPVNVPQEVLDLVEERRQARKDRHYSQADQLRNKIKKLGFDIIDTDKGSQIKKLS